MINYDDNEQDPIETFEDKIVDEYIKELYSKINHLQSYLDEYCYRFNRRFWQNLLFERLLTVCVNICAITYVKLT